MAQGTHLGEVKGESEVEGLQWKHSEEEVEIAIQEQEHRQEFCVSGFDPSMG